MKKLLTILFAVALGLNLSAQVPDYVPSDGLVAWWPMNGDVLDNGPTGMNGVNYGAQCDMNRNQSPCEAMSFTAGDYLSIAADSSFTSQEGTMTGWVKLNSYASQSGASGYNHFFNRWEVSSHEFVFAANIYGLYMYVENELFQSDTLPSLNEWHHMAFSYSSINGMAKIYIDGQNVAEFVGVDTLTPTNHPLHIGGNPLVPAYNSVDGSMDDVGFWERTLELYEITALYNAQLPALGCTDSIACNFNEEANIEDDSCVYPLFGEDCETGGAACGEGTIWDADIQACVVSDFCQEDLDGDGVIGINDLMQLLSSFGTMCPIWMCGDLVNYHGYDYATVQIGDQCWFAENLLTEFYDNGDGILGDLSDEDWTATSDGAQAIFDDSISNLNVYGRLYNFYAVLDERSLCPAGWHVPEDSSWDTLTESLGGIDYAGLALKSSADDLPSWDGDNSSGFSGLPGGYRDLDGDYVSPSKGRWWSSTVYGCGAWHRDLFPNNDALLLSSYCNRAGFSVRCLKD